MANLTNSGKLITKIESIDSSISSIEEKLWSVPAGTDIMEEIGAINDKIGTLPAGKTAAEAIADAAQDAADVASDLSDFESEVASTYATKADIGSVYKYKGSVANYAALPASWQTIGDVYNVEAADASHGIKAGDNVAWNGSAWDVLAGTVDLSAYATTQYVDDEIDAVEGTITTLAGRVTTAEGKITTLEGKMTTAEGDIDAVEGRLDTAESDIDALETASAARYTKAEINTMTGLNDASAGFVSNTVAENASTGKVTVTAADNVSVATAETNNKSAIANLGTAHNNLVDRVEAVESATGSLPFEAYFVDGTFAGKVLEISNANILATSHVSFVVKSGSLNGYAVEREVQAGKVILTSSDVESCTVEVMIINKKSS